MLFQPIYRYFHRIVFQFTTNYFAKISKYSIHPTQIQRWKQLALQGFPEIFSKTAVKTVADKNRVIDELYKQVGLLKVELDWLKKNLDLSIEQMRGKIDFMPEQITISRQCESLVPARLTLHYQSKEITPYDLLLMRKSDEQYLVTPFYGFRRMTAWLQRDGYDVNRRRVKRLCCYHKLKTGYVPVAVIAMIWQPRSCT